MSSTRHTSGDGDDWDAHWADFSASAELNPAQAYRFRQVRRLLAGAGVSRGARILDIGCGTGDFLRHCHTWFPESELGGLEMSRTGVELTRSKVPLARIVQADLIAEGGPSVFSEWATHAVCSEVLEHVDDPTALLRSAAMCLQTGAILVVTVPGGPRTAYDRHIGHRQHFEKGRLKAVMQGAGFEVTRLAAAGFPFHNLYRLTVLLRGARLVADARMSRQTSFVQRLVLSTFGALFRANLPSSPFGWQMVATGRKRAQPAR